MPRAEPATDRHPIGKRHATALVAVVAVLGALLPVAAAGADPTPSSSIPASSASHDNGGPHFRVDDVDIDLHLDIDLDIDVDSTSTSMPTTPPGRVHWKPPRS